MIFKIILVGFILFMFVMCYSCVVVAKMAEEEEKGMWDNLNLGEEEEEG